MPGRVAIGIDVGTQGARVVAAAPDGEVVAQSEIPFAASEPGLPDGWCEQDPQVWWRATRACLRDAADQLCAAGIPLHNVAAIAVDSTSGTILLADARGAPVRRALLYSDRRAQQEAGECCDAAGEFLRAAGYRFNASFALPKLLWLRRHEPDAWRSTRRILHAADWIAGQLTGCFDLTDQSSALKTGLDLRTLTWPPFLAGELGIDTDLLPRAVLSGSPTGAVTRVAAQQTGLAEGTPVVGGMTDACSDQIASGARRPGDWHTVLGSTLVLKGLSEDPLLDPLGRVYCHRHPMGWWMPGGACSTGARAVDALFAGADRDALERGALAASPTRCAAYPLDGLGERFPFVQPDAAGFLEGDPGSEPGRYAAALEGVACAERLSYDVLRDLGAPVGDRIYTTGGGSRSAAWLQVRADILNRRMVRARHASAAMGSAIIAASHTLFADLAGATAAMVRIDTVVEPRPDRDRYEAVYERFREALVHRGWLVATVCGHQGRGGRNPK